MLTALTDILVCPRCGPPHSLILLADEVREGRVLEGLFGCANCLARYPVRRGFADLVPPPAGPPAREGPAPRPPGETTGEGPVPPRPAGADVATRLAALIGMAPAPPRSFSLVVGPGAVAAPGMAAAAPGAEVLAADQALAAWTEAPGVSRLAVGSRLPFSDRSVRGVALTAGADAALLADCARVLNPMGRLLMEEAPPDVAARLAALGLRVAAREGSAVVAVVAGGG